MMDATARSLVLWAAVVALLALCGGALGTPADRFRTCEEFAEHTLTQRRPSLRSSEPDVVYNSVWNEYFIVYVSEEVPGRTAIYGQRLSEAGGVIGGPIQIWGYSDANDEIDSSRKEFPVVAYNSKDDYYMVVWEYDFQGDGSDYDVVGRKVNSDGTMPETAVMISYSWGRDDSPHMAYSPVDNAFVLVHELEMPDERGIAVQRLNATHLIGDSLLLGTDYVDREPFITYHPPTNKFFVVWEWDQENNQQTEIGAVIVSGVPLAADNSAPNLVGSTVEVTEEGYVSVHDHDAKVAYSTKDDLFLLIWEIDSADGDKEVVGTRMSTAAESLQPLLIIGSPANPYDRHPVPAYVPQVNEFLVVFESGRSANTTHVEMASFHSHTMHEHTVRFKLSRTFDNEHWPTVCVSANCTTALTVWRSGHNFVPSHPPTEDEQYDNADEDYYKREAKSASAAKSFAAHPEPGTPKPFAVNKLIPSGGDHGHKRMMPIGSSTKQRRSPKAAGESVAQVPAQRAHDQEVAPPASIQLSLVCLPGRNSMCPPVGGGGGSDGASGGGDSGGSPADKSGSTFTMTNVVIMVSVVFAVMMVAGVGIFLLWKHKLRSSGWQPVVDLGDGAQFSSFQADSFVGDDDM